MFSNCRDAGCQLYDNLVFSAQGIAAAMAEFSAPTIEAAPWFLPALAGIVGAFAASFAGVVADRLPRRMGINGPAEPDIGLAMPPSHCDGCGTRLSPLALIPVAGWIASQGRCTSCDAQIPKRYPIIEASTAAASAATLVYFGQNGAGLAMCLLLWLLVIVSWLDWTAEEIPDFLTAPIFFLGLLASPLEPDIGARVLGALFCGGFLLTIFRVTGSAKKVDTMSYGDVTLAGALGAWLGIDSALPFMLAAAAAYVAYAAPLRAKGRVWVPMGPGLAAGFAMVAILGIGI